jgi:CheY-like chemotaxis protein
MARILLIDDNDAFRPLLRMSLEAAGHEVAEACNGNEGLRLYRDYPADVVVCDLFMPEKDGLETIRALRASGDVKIIAISGEGPLAHGGMLNIARALGAAKTLSKPVDAETVLEALEEVLSGSI